MNKKVVPLRIPDDVREAVRKLSRALGDPKDVLHWDGQSIEAALIELAADRLEAMKRFGVQQPANDSRLDKACPNCPHVTGTDLKCCGRIFRETDNGMG